METKIHRKSESLSINQSRTKRKQGKSWGEFLTPYLFIFPFLAFFLIFFLGPALYSFVLSFYRYRGYGEAQFAGIDNYVRALDYHVFWTTLENTLFYWVGHAVPMMALAFFLAVLVNSKLVVHKNFFKPLIFLPQIVASVASALVFQNFFGTHTGALNNMLGTDIPWLEDMDLARWAVVILLVWRGIGYWFIIFLAGLTSINEEVNEAATVDGASSFQKLFYITIPLMRSTFLFAFIVDGIVTLRLFAEPNVLGGRGGALAPVEMAPVLNLVVNNIRGARFGDAAAVGWILFVITVFITIVQYLILGRRRKEQ
ncbi:MAG: sugar ABC transporter permease [Aggregatilineales bacterium]